MKQSKTILIHHYDVSNFSTYTQNIVLDFIPTELTICSAFIGDTTATQIGILCPELYSSYLFSASSTAGQVTTYPLTKIGLNIANKLTKLTFDLYNLETGILQTTVDTLVLLLKFDE